MPILFLHSDIVILTPIQEFLSEKNWNSFDLLRQELSKPHIFGNFTPIPINLHNYKALGKLFPFVLFPFDTFIEKVDIIAASIM